MENDLIPTSTAGAYMREAAKLLKRKKKLLDRRQQTEFKHVATVERELRKIDEALTRLEVQDAPPTVPILPTDRSSP